jgi:epoxide hydrolase-like predicted phosphatase
VKGLVLDWGGVLTNGIDAAFASWAQRDGVIADHLGLVLREAFTSDDTDEPNPVHALERGEIDAAQFETRLAAELARHGSAVPAQGLLARMFAGISPSDSMLGLVARVKQAGLRTAVLSNSWGNEYPMQGWDELFDAVVISGEVGMRKPEPRIFRHVLGLIGLAASDCVFVDDLAHNVTAAVELGFVGVVHRSYDETAAELEAILGMELR